MSHSNPSIHLQAFFVVFRFFRQNSLNQTGSLHSTTQHNKTCIADTWNNYKRIPFYGELCAWLRDSAEKTSKLRPNATKRRAQWNLTSSFIPAISGRIFLLSLNG